MRRRRRKHPLFEVTLQHIVEGHVEYCAVCKEHKEGRFTVFYVDKDGERFYFAVCRECLQ